VKVMVKCPRCNIEVRVPERTWNMAGRPDQNGFRTVLSIGLFNCPVCRATFRQVLRRATERTSRLSHVSNVRICPSCGHPNALDTDYCVKCETLFADRGFAP
jgi:hypothetical protein